MSTVPRTEFTPTFRCDQVYQFLFSEGFHNIADEFCRKVDWNNLASSKVFLKKSSLPLAIKQKVFLILNNKACYFSSWFHAPTRYRRSYIGFNLMGGEI